MFKRLIFSCLLVGLLAADLAMAKDCEDGLTAVVHRLDERTEAAKAWGLIENFWTKEFAKLRVKLRPAHLVLYTEVVNTSCGRYSASIGPFYCPLDGKVYLDVVFWQMLEDALKRDSAASRLMVLAHEYGHHILTQLGFQLPAVNLILSDETPGREQIWHLIESLADALAGYLAGHLDRLGRLTTDDRVDLDALFFGIGDDQLNDFFSALSFGEIVYCHGCGTDRLRSFRAGAMADNLYELFVNRYIDFDRGSALPDLLKTKLRELLFGKD